MIFFVRSIIGIVLMLGVGACQAKRESSPEMHSSPTHLSNMNPSDLDTITLGAGCFWCVEAIFQQLDGVISVKSGYSGGHVRNPAYREVCNGTTGHAEVCQLVFNPKKITLHEILEVFWQTHDPTTLNKQGADVGTQYRSAIFYHNEAQKNLASELKNKLNEENAFGRPVVTEITAFSSFYPAEDYHQNYYNQNGSEPYCRMVIQPKLEKFKKVFGSKTKTR